MNYDEKTKERAVQMYLDGKLMLAIEAMSGASNTSIRRWVMQAGHKLRSPGGQTRISDEAIARAMHVNGGNQRAAARSLGMAPSNITYRLNGDPR